MKISEQELKQIIKEELSKVMGKEEVTEAASLNPFRRSHESGRETGLRWRKRIGKWLDIPGAGAGGDETTPTATPTPGATPAAPATPEAGDSGTITLSMKDRRPTGAIDLGSESSSIHTIALGMLGLEGAPNPNGTTEEKELNKKFNKLMILITKGVENTIKQIDPKVKVNSVNESVKE
tara:strand:+ start:743 stop:1279 length:537 start_codon:yes stop_codon:yes gene_type:complete